LRFASLFFIFIPLFSSLWDLRSRPLLCVFSTSFCNGLDPRSPFDLTFLFAPLPHDRLLSDLRSPSIRRQLANRPPFLSPFSSSRPHLHPLSIPTLDVLVPPNRMSGHRWSTPHTCLVRFLSPAPQPLFYSSPSFLLPAQLVLVLLKPLPYLSLALYVLFFITVFFIDQSTNATTNQIVSKLLLCKPSVFRRIALFFLVTLHFFFPCCISHPSPQIS